MGTEMRAGTRASYEQRILRALLYVENNFHRELTLEELASVAFFSPYHFHRVFRGMVGESVIEYARRLRLENAAYRLRSTRRPVTRLALEAGYESADAFGRAFRALFGVSPTAFRRRTQPPHERGEDRALLSHRLPGSDGTGAAAAGVEVRRFDPVRLVCTRHVGPYTTVWRSWRRLEDWAGRALPAARGRRVGISHDDPEMVPPERLRYDACLAAGPDFQLPPADAHGWLFLRDLPAGAYAVTVHRGPYHLLGDAYTRLYCDWLPWSGREPADVPAVEVYLNTPGEVAQEDLLTEIRLPLRP